MKRNEHEKWLARVAVGAGQPTARHADAIEQLLRKLRAGNRDLKARLKRCEQLVFTCEAKGWTAFCDSHDAATDLKNKNWRKR